MTASPSRKASEADLETPEVRRLFQPEIGRERLQTFLRERAPARRGCAHARGTACGALFFVIQNCATESRAAYGKLHLQQDGRLTFDGSEIENMALLARRCVASMARRKETLKLLSLPRRACPRADGGGRSIGRSTGSRS